MNASRRDVPPDRADEAWVRAAVERYEVPLIQYAARMLGGDVDRARDVVQDAFLRLWTADRKELDGHLGQWLFKVCRNRALDVHRKESRMTTLNDEQVLARERPRGGAASPGLTGVPAADRETSAGMLGILHTLPDRQQEVLRLKFQAGLSYREIAAVMEITVNHVGVLIHTAVAAIREKMTMAGVVVPEAVQGTSARAGFQSESQTGSQTGAR